MQRTTRMVVTALLMAFVGIAGVALAAPQREIVVWMAYAHVTDEYKTWFDKQTERFERENPGASVRFEYIRGINDKLLAASAAGVAPDMTHASIAYARSLYEAGAIDGIRNRWQELWHITLPSMKPQLLFGAVMQITASFSVGDVSMQLAGFPSVSYAGRTVLTHLIDYGTVRFEMGYASATATLLFLSMIFANLVIQKLIRKVGQ